MSRQYFWHAEGVEVRGEESGDVAGYYGGAERSSASVGVEGEF